LGTKKTVVLVVPNVNNVGTMLCERISEKNSITPILFRDVVGLEEVRADAYIIYRESLEDLNILRGLQGEVAILYGDIPVPEAERDHGFTNLTGKFPRCVMEWIAKIEGNSGRSTSLSWDDEEETSGSSGHSTAWPKVKKVAVWSPGGGVGKTTTVVHLAKLAEQHQLNVGIIETDEDKGGVLRYLGRKPAVSGLDSLSAAEWIDEDLFNGEMDRIVQTVGKIQVAPMIGTLRGLTCTNESLKILHRWTSSHFGLTIYDLPPRLRDIMTYSVLNEADKIIIVAEPTDVLMDALQKILRICLEVQEFRDVPKKSMLLVNKVPNSEGLDPQEMASILGLPLIGVIPADLEHYDRIINKGKFDIPLDSPWRLVFAGLGLGGQSNLPIITDQVGIWSKKKPMESAPAKKRGGFFSFFYAR